VVPTPRLSGAAATSRALLSMPSVPKSRSGVLVGIPVCNFSSVFVVSLHIDQRRRRSVVSGKTCTMHGRCWARPTVSGVCRSDSRLVISRPCPRPASCRCELAPMAWVRFLTKPFHRTAHAGAGVGAVAAPVSVVSRHRGSFPHRPGMRAPRSGHADFAGVCVPCCCLARGLCTFCMSFVCVFLMRV
jgi:hypothetical protein